MSGNQVTISGKIHNIIIQMTIIAIKGITPDVSLSEILKGSIPFMLIMALAIVILCIFPEIVTWLPDKIMGKDLGF